MPPPEGITRDSPCSRHQTHLRTWYDSSDGPQTAVFSNPLCSLERPCFHCSKRSKLQPDRESSQPLKRLCSSHSEREQLCQDSTVNQECSNVNVGTKKKFKTLSVKYMTADELDLPGPSMNKPSSPAGQPMHLGGATNSKRSRTNINEIKHRVSSDSPRDWGQSQPRLPKWEVPQDRHALQGCVLSWQIPRPKVEVENESVDTTQRSHQLEVSD